MSATYPLLLIWGNVVFKYVKWSVPSTEDGSWLWLHSQPGCKRWKTTYPYLSESQFRNRNKWVLDHLKEIKIFFPWKLEEFISMNSQGQSGIFDFIIIIFFCWWLGVCCDATLQFVYFRTNWYVWFWLLIVHVFIHDSNY